LEWTSDGTSIHVSVKAENGRTRLQFMGDAGFKLIGSFVPVALATLITIISLGNAGTLTFGLGAAIVAGAYAVARGLWEYSGDRAGKKYRRMVDRLAEEMSRLAEPATGGGDALLPGPEDPTVG
ncbi:MAG: hypothetical protein OEU54_10070, partial [Gemmatimonadota bacterium]|nr:hypothetical protein [Gemmatimonadota bacterium]